MMKIKLLLMDVDGTLTDGRIYLSGCGEEFKAFNIKDGYGIKQILPLHGILPIIITGRKSSIVKKRAKELGITSIFQGVSDKSSTLKTIQKQYGVSYDEMAYIGDDINDLPIISNVAITACPADAADEIKNAVKYLCSKKGGEGAVREFIEYIISTN